MCIHIHLITLYALNTCVYTMCILIHLLTLYMHSRIVCTQPLTNTVCTLGMCEYHVLTVLTCLQSLCMSLSEVGSEQRVCSEVSLQLSKGCTNLVCALTECSYHLTRHVLCVMCHMSFFSSFWWSYSMEGLLSTGPTLSSFAKYHTKIRIWVGISERMNILNWPKYDHHKNTLPP